MRCFQVRTSIQRLMSRDVVSFSLEIERFEGRRHVGSSSQNMAQVPNDVWNSAVRAFSRNGDTSVIRGTRVELVTTGEKNAGA